MLSLPGVELGVLGRDEALARRGRGVIAASPRTARHARGDREARARGDFCLADARPRGDGAKRDWFG